MCYSSAPEIGSLPVDDKSHGKSSKASSKKQQASLLPKSSSSPCSVADSSKCGIASSSASSLSSPKPKRNLFDGFKQTLRGKSYDGSKGSGREKDSPVSTPVSGCQTSSAASAHQSSDDVVQVQV